MSYFYYTILFRSLEINYYNNFSILDINEYFNFKIIIYLFI